MRVRVLVCSVLCLLLSVFAWSDEAEQVRMLKELFALPESSWRRILSENRELLDEVYLENVRQRILWDLAHELTADAARFALVGDLSLEILGRTPEFVALVKQEAPASMLPLEPLRQHSRAVAVDPLGCRLSIRAARSALAAGQLDEAERFYHEALVYDPKSLTGWLELGRLHQIRGQIDLAAQDYRQATRLWPGRAELWSLRARCVERQFDRESNWGLLDEARMCFGKAHRLGQPQSGALIRLDKKARTLAARRVHLNKQELWQIRSGQYHCFTVGEPHGYHPYRDGDPTSDQQLSGEWRPLEGEAGEDLRGYLIRSYEPGYAVDSLSNEPAYDTDLGIWRGYIVWVRTSSQHAKLWQGDRCIGSLRSAVERWPLGKPFARFRDSQRDMEIRLFRAASCEIALEVARGKVAAVYLMEPGRLRPNLQRLPRYRQL